MLDNVSMAIFEDGSVPEHTKIMQKNYEDQIDKLLVQLKEVILILFSFQFFKIEYNLSIKNYKPKKLRLGNYKVSKLVHN